MPPRGEQASSNVCNKIMWWWKDCSIFFNRDIQTNKTTDEQRTNTWCRMDVCCLSIFPTSLRRLRNFWQSDSYNVGNCNKNKKKLFAKIKRKAENKRKRPYIRQTFHRIDQAERSTDKENVVEIVVNRKKRHSEGSLIGWIVV